MSAQLLETFTGGTSVNYFATTYLSPFLSRLRWETGSHSCQLPGREVTSNQRPALPSSSHQIWSSQAVDRHIIRPTERLFIKELPGGSAKALKQHHSTPALRSAAVSEQPFGISLKLKQGPVTDTKSPYLQLLYPYLQLFCMFYCCWYVKWCTLNMLFVKFVISNSSGVTPTSPKIHVRVHLCIWQPKVCFLYPMEGRIKIL